MGLLVSAITMPDKTAELRIWALPARLVIRNKFTNKQIRFINILH